MKVLDMKLSSITPYENNPRNNDEAVEPVMNSIREFGFKVPIVIDKDNIIVAGHTRYKAAKKLKLETVPCIIADDLTEEQIRAFRLADNKTGEIATWDLDLLNIELENIFNVDMEMFDFNNIIELPDELEREVETNEKFIIRITFDTYKDWLDKEDELRTFVEKCNANMAVGSV